MGVHDGAADVNQPEGWRELLLSSPHAMHRTSWGAQPLRPQPLSDAFPPGAVALCAPLSPAGSATVFSGLDSAPSASKCLLAEVSGGNVVFQKFGNTEPRVSLRLDGGLGATPAPWRSLVGAQVHCEGVASMIVG